MSAPRSETPSAGAQSRPLIALAYMTVATLSFSLMAVSGRELAGNLDTFEIMMYRSIIGVIIVLSIVYIKNLKKDIKTDALGLHALRNLAHFAGQNLWFFAVATIPFSQVFALEFSVPIWVALAAPFFLNERLTKSRIGAAVLGFIGILLVARPDAASLSPGLIAALLCAVGFTITAIVTKKLTRTEATISIMFWLTTMQLCFGIVAAGHDLDIALPTTADLPWLIAVGLCGLTAHYSFASALSHAPATIVAPLDFARLPLIAVIGMMFYNEPLAPLVLVGAAIVFGANFLNIWVETRK